LLLTCSIYSYLHGNNYEAIKYRFLFKIGAFGLISSFKTQELRSSRWRKNGILSEFFLGI